MRSGPEPDVVPAAQAGIPASGWRANFAIPADLPLAPTLVVAACWSLFWLPLFSQGLVPAAFKLAGSEEKVWFLALHLSEPWQWPVIIAMIAAGAAMLVLGLAIPRRAGRRRSVADSGLAAPVGGG